MEPAAPSVLDPLLVDINTRLAEAVGDISLTNGTTITNSDVKAPWPKLPKGVSPTVGIIGAGIAGLRAAQVLTDEMGFENVVVIEARDRVGGRVSWAFLLGEGGYGGSDEIEESLADCRSWGLRKI